MEKSSREWLVPLTGIGFVVLIIISFIIQGEPPDAGDGAAKVIDHYKDNKDSIEIGGIVGAAGATLLIFFFAYLRKVLSAAEGANGMLSLLPVIGAAIIGLGAMIDSTISFALAEAVDDIPGDSVLALQALWDNDFLPFVLGSQVLWFSLAFSILRYGALPKWLGWVALVFGIASLTPAGFFAFLAGGVWIVIVSILLSQRARSAGTPPAPAAS
jgi:hypothetical protein